MSREQFELAMDDLKAAGPEGSLNNLKPLLDALGLKGEAQVARLIQTEVEMAIEQYKFDTYIPDWNR